jgi:hypothetical protein
MGDLSPIACFTNADQRRAFVLSTQQIFGEVDPCIGKPASVSNAGSGFDHPFTGTLSAHVTKRPDGAPEVT